MCPYLYNSDVCQTFVAPALKYEVLKREHIVLGVYLVKIIMILERTKLNGYLLIRLYHTISNIFFITLRRKTQVWYYSTLTRLQTTKEHIIVTEI